MLIVDDNKSWHEILANNLSIFSIDVSHAYSGSEALAMLNKCDKKYDLILMDWNMPELDGIETTRKLHEQCKDNYPPAVIMVSSFRQESISKLANDVGIDIFLQKPVNPSILNDILNDIFSDKNIKEVYKANKKSLVDDISLLENSNILLVEDNLTNQLIVIGLLEDSGINIDIANNGQEAVDMFKQNRDKYEIILMDIQMPILDGYDATKLIRELNKNIPIIALTANAMKEDVERTKAVGMNEHLNKPIDVEKLYETLLKYISTKTDLNKSKSGIYNFKNISEDIGLSYLAGNRKLYLKLLNGFYDSYKDFSFDGLDDEEFKRFIHTIKGLSAGIGAEVLHKTITLLEESEDKSLVTEFYKELDKVLDDLKGIQQLKDDV